MSWRSRNLPKRGTYLHFGEVPDIAEVLQVTQKDISKVYVATPATTTGVPASSTAAARRADLPTARVTHWLADTGCGYDLVSQLDVSKISGQIKASERPLTFLTANRATQATEAICLKLDELGEDIEP